MGRRKSQKMVLNNWFFNNLIINFDCGVCIIVPIEKIIDEDSSTKILSIYFFLTRKTFARKKNEPIFYTIEYNEFIRCVLNLPFKFFMSFGFDKSNDIVA